MGSTPTRTASICHPDLILGLKCRLRNAQREIRDAAIIGLNRAWPVMKRGYV